MTTKQHNKLVADIASGRYEGSLMDIVEAVQTAFAKGVKQVRWKLTHDDCTFTEESMTVGEIRIAERLTDSTWIELSPSKSAEDLVAIYTAHLLKHHGMKESEAVAKAEAVTIKEFTEMFSQYEVLPLDDAEAAVS